MKNFLKLATLAFAISCSGRGADANGIARDDVVPSSAVAPSASAIYAVPVDGLPTIGKSDALVTIVEFTDYDCPFCARAEHTMSALREKYGADLRVAVAEHPLPMHPRARVAALAALGVDDASFGAVHAALFENPDARSPDALAKIVQGASRRSGAPDSLLANAEALASTLHVTGTPMFFVNGRKISGAQPFDTFDALVSEEVARARAMVAAGVARSNVYDAIAVAARANPPPIEDDVAEKITVIPAARDVGGAQFLGDPNARIVMTLFTDFECPYCKKLDARLREIVAAHSDVRVVLRNKPLPMHPHARLAAKAAIAAAAQNKLDPYAQILFANQNALDHDALVTYASRASLDVARFTRDLDSDDTNVLLAEDEAIAAKLDVKGTPTSFVGARLVVGAQPVATFEDAIQWTAKP